MNELVQTLVALVVVLAAAAYVGRRVWRTLRPQKAAGCASGCGCGDDEKRDGGDWART